MALFQKNTSVSQCEIQQVKKLSEYNHFKVNASCDILERHGVCECIVPRVLNCELKSAQESRAIRDLLCFVRYH